MSHCRSLFESILTLTGCRTYSHEEPALCKIGIGWRPDGGWRTADGRWKNAHDKYVDDKMLMAKCGWQNTNDKILIRGNF